MRQRILSALAACTLVAVGLGTAVTSDQAAAIERAPAEEPDQAGSGQAVSTKSVDHSSTAQGSELLSVIEHTAGRAHLTGQMLELMQDGPTADELRAATEECGTQISNGEYPERVGETPTVPVCQKGDAIFWKSGMTIDCDGQRTDECNEDTDQYYQPETSCQESDGEYLTASELPFVVVPLRSSIWDAREHGIDCGTVVAVTYEDRVVYGVMGDRGPDGQIGEGSYALADALGIDPDPSTGGISGGVVDYIAFPDVTASPIEDHSVAESLGAEAANAFVSQ